MYRRRMRKKASRRGAQMIDVRMFTVGPVQENCFIVRRKGAADARDRRPGRRGRPAARRAREARDRDRRGDPDHPHPLRPHRRGRAGGPRDRRAGLRAPSSRRTCWRTSWTTCRGPGSARSRATRPTTPSPAARRSSSPASTFDVIFTPGHSPGHVTYAVAERGRAVLGRRPVPGLGRPGRPAGRRLADAAGLDRVAGRARTRPRPPSIPATWGSRRSGASAPRTRSCASSRSRVSTSVIQAPRGTFDILPE